MEETGTTRRHKRMDEKKLAYKRALQDLQLNRLKGTFQDQIEGEKHRAMCVYFTEHLYSARDFTERNESFMKLIRSFERTLGKDMLHTASQLLELHDLSDQLDEEIVDKLIEMGCGLDFTMEDYERAYFLVDNYDIRVHQIDLIVESVHRVHHIAHWPFMGFLLKTLYAGARVLRATAIVDFLQAGYDAMHSVDDPTEFTALIRERELQRLDRIYGVTK
ncbi:MAG: hypothetical protein HY814_08900 [Candidatus Riflebacteria bacterium]|nr:hypothetical protein [Candidatus Riflebacteria bacterium]